MTQTDNKPTTYTDLHRMELRSHVNLAGDVVARLWPMRTFISRNPLQGFEHLPFEEAVRKGEQLFGGRGYLSCKVYREAYHSGRIAQCQLDQALEPLVSRRSIVFGQRRVSHLEVLRAAVVHGADATCLGRSLWSMWTPGTRCLS